MPCQSSSTLTMEARFSPRTLWQLRTGARENLTIRHIAALARFFGVASPYFFDEDLIDLPEVELKLLVADEAQAPALRDVALRRLQ
jgi:hypothetical protein